VQMQFERGHWGEQGIRAFLEMVLESAVAAAARSST
jgi:hypothetical protein